MLTRLCALAIALLASAICSSLARAQVVNSEWNTGNGSWNVVGNWFPSAVPDNGGGFTYNVQIGNRPVAAGAQVTFVPEDGTSDTISTLTVSNLGNPVVSGADLLTNGNQLIVLGQTTIDGAGSTIRVDDHATPGTVAFNTNNLDLNNGGGLTMEGGIATIDVLFEINAGTLGGHGAVNVGDNDAVVEEAFENSSLIQASSNSAAPQTLTIRTIGADTLDLDGDSESGVVDVSNALANVNADTVTLIVDGPLSDAFSGTLQIGQRDTITFNDNFTMSGADVTMNGGSQVATLNGPGDVTNIASSTFTITGDAVVGNDLTFTGPLNVVTVNANGSLTLAGTVTMADASMLSMAGGANLVITGATTLIEAGGDIDWDGTGNNAITTIVGAGHLTLTVDQVDVGNNIFNGTLNLNDGGDLTVNNTINSWQAAGLVNKNGASTSTISGDELAVTGDLNVNAGTLDVNADAIFGTTSDIIVAAGATADMATTQIFDGADVTVNGTLSLGAASLIEAPAQIVGAGLFRLNSTSTIAGNAVINTTSFDWDGLSAGNTHAINDGVVFTINSTVWDADDATPGVDDNINLGGSGAQIVVSGVAEWTMARTLTANTAAAGTATIGGTALLNVEGALAVLNVDGNTNITAPVSFGAGSTTSIDAGMELDLGASAGFDGGTIGGLGTFQPATANVVSANSMINVTNFDFDAGNWVIQNNALLTVNVTDYDALIAPNAFDASITLNNGDISVTTGDAEFVMDGVLNMNSSVEGQIVVWSGEPLDIGNDAGALDADLNVTGTRQSQIATEVDFNSDADVNIAAGATLALLSTVNFSTVNAGNNAQFTGAGAIAFSGPVNVNEAVTLHMVGGQVDLDGLDSVGDFVNIDAPLAINALAMANFGRANGGGGTNTLDINNSVGAGALTVNLDDAEAEWTLNGPGVMNLVNDNTEATLLAGSDVNINGTVNVTGDVRVTARLDIGGIININTAGQPLRLGGGNAGPDINTISGATISGVGLLGADTGKRLQGFGTITADIDFDGTASLRAAGGTLTVGGDIVDVNILGTADETGTLNVVNPWETDGGVGGSIGAVVLEGGVLQGGVITNDNLNGLQGHGTITSRVINNSKIVATGGGTLLLHTAGNDNDWDGATNAGELQALSADLELVNDAMFSPAFNFSGAVRAINDNSVFANGFGFNFTPTSTLELEDEAVFRSTESTDIGGVVAIAAGANAAVQVTNNFFLTFASGSTTTLDGDLTLVNNNINIEQGAVFNNGGGALLIPDGSHVVADNLANIGVLFDMQGAFRPGNFEGIGRVNLFDYQNASTSELYVELRGTALNAFDRLVASGDIVLDGYLNIDIDESSPGVPFVPALGNTFNIITGSSVTGTFDSVDVSGMPAGLAFHVEYLSNAVQLQVVSKPIFSADFDDDGDVDQTDLAIWDGAFDLNQLGDADGDNDSDGNDFLIWQRQFGSKPAVAAQSPVPEPAALTMMLAALLTLAGSRRARRSPV